MEYLPKKTCQNGIGYTLVGDYYIPDLQLPEESRPIGIWGRMHKAYLEQCHPVQYSEPEELTETAQVVEVRFSGQEYRGMQSLCAGYRGAAPCWGQG